MLTANKLHDVAKDYSAFIFQLKQSRQKLRLYYIGKKNRGCEPIGVVVLRMGWGLCSTSVDVM